MKFASPRLISLLCVGSALGGCAGRVQTFSPVATTEHPRVVELTVVGMIQPGTRFIADGVSAVREEYPLQAYHDERLNGLPAAQVRIMPTVARWAKFWRVVDRLDLAAWRPEYSQGDVPPDRLGNHWYITDALQWTMCFSTPGRALASKGDGAAPTIGRPSRVMSEVGPVSRNGVLVLEDAFVELLKP